MLELTELTEDKQNLTKSIESLEDMGRSQIKLWIQLLDESLQMHMNMTLLQFVEMLQYGVETEVDESRRTTLLEQFPSLIKVNI